MPRSLALALSEAAGNGESGGTAVAISTEPVGGNFITVDPAAPMHGLSCIDAGSADLLYCRGVIERLPREEVGQFLAECFRVLVPLGLLRIATTDVDAIIHGYLFEWASTEEESSSRTRRLNTAIREPGINFLYGEEELRNVLTEAGFRAIRRFTFGASSDKRLWNLEYHQLYALILEANKP